MGVFKQAVINSEEQESLAEVKKNNNNNNNNKHVCRFISFANDKVEMGLVTFQSISFEFVLFCFLQEFCES